MSKDTHRPLVKIDWDEVDKLAIAGCNGRRIAGHLGIHEETFYKRVVIEKGVGFSEYLHSKRAKGEALIEAAQFYKAIGASTKGDTSLLIHLGKHKLGQVDKSVNDTNKAFEEIDPTKRDAPTDTLQVPVQTLPGSSLESPEGGLQEGSPLLA